MKIAFWLNPASAVEPQSPIVIEGECGTETWRYRYVYCGYMIGDLFIFHSKTQPAIEEWQDDVKIGENWLQYNLSHRDGIVTEDQIRFLPCDTYWHANGQLAEIKFAERGVYQHENAKKYTSRGVINGN